MSTHSQAVEEPPISPLQRRSVEIDVADTFLSVLTTEIGQDAANAVFRQVVDRLAESSADTWRQSHPEPTLSTLWEVWQVLGAEGRLDLELLELSPRVLRFHVHRCSYAELYRSRDLEAVGVAFSCQRDAPFARALVPGVVVKQSPSILQGNHRCEFEYTLEEA